MDSMRRKLADQNKVSPAKNSMIRIFSSLFPSRYTVREAYTARTGFVIIASIFGIPQLACNLKMPEKSAFARG
jgi:hypothetical protein